MNQNDQTNQAEEADTILSQNLAKGTKALLIGHRLYSLADEHAAWSQEKFGTDMERGPLGPIRHLKKEADEADEAYQELQKAIADGDPHAAMLAQKFNEEKADMLLLLLDLNRRSGGTLADLVEAGHEKLKIVKTRIYHRTPDGVPSEHVREQPGLSLAAGFAVVGRRAGAVWKWLLKNRRLQWILLFVLYSAGVMLLMLPLWKR